MAFFTEERLSGITCNMLNSPGSCRVQHQKSTNLPTGVNGLPFIVSSEGSTAATVQIFNANSPALQILDAWCHMVGAGATSDTWSLNDGTTIITDAVDCSSASDKDILRIGTIDDAKNTLAADATLDVDRASACAADVFVLCVFKD